VELKARFDEENNIYWARRLERVGACGLWRAEGLKTPQNCNGGTREADRIRRYVHIGTGNYN